MHFYFIAFYDLSSERKIGMGPGAIPFSSIVFWANKYNLTEWEFQELKYLINRMDTVWLDWWEAEQKKKQKRDTKKATK